MPGLNAARQPKNGIRPSRCCACTVIDCTMVKLTSRCARTRNNYSLKNLYACLLKACRSLPHLTFDMRASANVLSCNPVHASHDLVRPWVSRRCRNPSQSRSNIRHQLKLNAPFPSATKRSHHALTKNSQLLLCCQKCVCINTDPLRRQTVRHTVLYSFSDAQPLGLRTKHPRLK